MCSYKTINLETDFCLLSTSFITWLFLLIIMWVKTKNKRRYRGEVNAKSFSGWVKQTD